MEVLYRLFRLELVDEVRGVVLVMMALQRIRMRVGYEVFYLLRGRVRSYLVEEI